MNNELKALIEKRNETITKMKGIVDKIKVEKRSLTDEESSNYESLKKEVEELDKTIAIMEDAEKRSLTENKNQKKDETEVRAASDILADYIRGIDLSVEERAAMSTTTDGVIIPTELSKDIINDVKESSDLISDISIVNSTGTFKQIVEKEKPTAGWTDELAEVTESDGKFETIEIGHYKLGALVKISNELINQADFDITGYMAEQLVEAFDDKLEEAIYSGTGNKQPTGLTSTTTANTYMLASAVAITVDELISIKNSVKSRYRKNSVWRMNSSTLSIVEKLKDNNGNLIFRPDVTEEYDGRILGYPVKTTDAAPEMAPGACPIIFGNIKKAYKGNLNPRMMLQVLREKYATQGAIGLLGFLFFDGKMVNNKACTVVKCPGE